MMYKYRFGIFWFIGFLLVFGLTLYMKSLIQKNSEIVVQLQVQSNDTTVIQMFFNDGRPFTKTKTQFAPCYPSSEFQKVFFTLPKSYALKNLRFDLGTKKGEMKIKSLALADRKRSLFFDALSIKNDFVPNNYIKSFEYVQDQNMIKVSTYEGDPYIINENLRMEFDELRIDFLLYNLLINILLVVEIVMLAILVSSKFKWAILKSRFVHLDYRKWFSIAFVGILFVPFFILVLNIFQTTKNMENRHLTDFPDINETGYGDYLGAYAGYFNDNFGLRTQMIALNNYIHFLYLGETASQRNVEMGDEAWLFVTAYLHHAYIKLFNNEELESIKTTLSQRGEYLNNLGIKYYLLIPPTKASAYKEFRPSFYKKFPELPNVQHVIRLFDDVDVVKTTPLTLAIAQTKEVVPIPIYYKYDSHWNSIGAKVGYDMIMRTIKKDFPNIHPIPNESYDISFDSTYQADLAKNIAIGDIVPRSEVVYTLKEESHVVDGTPKPYGHFAIFKDNVTGDSIKVLLFHDSFGVALMPFLAQTFSQSTFLWTTDFRYDIIEKEKPDIVIQERMQSYLSDFVKPNTDEFLERLEWSRTLNDSIHE